MPLFAAAIFASAFLLFQVQPVIAKIILPWFGGSAAVWTTCMLFFQVVLLAGYLYAYCTHRFLKPRSQATLHIALLAASLLLLPIAPGEGWKPQGSENPTLKILALLGVSIGLPYFLLSTTGPLLQAWYVRVNRGSVPYRLYALSNLASLAALVSYPPLVEPYLGTRMQSIVWSASYAAFAVLCSLIAWRSREAKELVEAEGEKEGERPGWQDWLLWMLLPAAASVLLLAVTNHLTQDVASVPFLWILPLVLYLLTFILCFDRPAWYKRYIFLPLMAAALPAMAYFVWNDVDKPDWEYVLAIYSGGFFVAAMVCHGELVRLKPHPRHLTAFYLMLSVGGALGGLFVGVLAPAVFRGFFELEFGLGACALLAPLALWRDGNFLFHRPRWWAAWGMTAAAVMALFLFLHRVIDDSLVDYHTAVRNFYGALRVRDDGFDNTRRLVHGEINHGEQVLAPQSTRQPTTYYCPVGGGGIALMEHRSGEPRRVGVIGLGAGTLATYGKPGDVYRIYEINQQVIVLAQREFSFLKESGAKIELAVGDARLSLEREAPQNFDVLLLDAFSGDSIPVHLLTREAFALYSKHMKPDGVLAVHVSNKHLDLEPVVAEAAKASGKAVRTIDTDDDEQYCFGATWTLISADKSFFERPAVRKASRDTHAKASFRMWTDDFSNLYRLLK